MKWWEKDNHTWKADWLKNVRKVEVIRTIQGKYPVYSNKKGGNKDE